MRGRFYCRKIGRFEKIFAWGSWPGFFRRFISPPFLGRGFTAPGRFCGVFAMIRKVKGGWEVVSRRGKRLGGPYRSRSAALRRLHQVEWFKRRGRGG